MGSVQDEIECPSCGYESAISDYYYKSGERYIWCHRCGFSYQRLIVKDARKTRQKYNEAKASMESGNLEEAVRILGLEHEQEYDEATKRWVPMHSRKRMRQAIEDHLDWMKQCKFRCYYKMDEHGNPVFKEKEHKAKGAMGYHATSALASVGGSYNKPADFEKFYRDNKGVLDKCYYTFKRDDKWFIKDLVNGTEKPFTDWMEQTR